MPNNPIQVVDDLALVPLTQSEVANLNLSSIGVMTITTGGGGGGSGDMLKSTFATLNPGSGFVDKAINASNVPYTGLTNLPGGSINFLRSDGTFAPPPGQVYGVVNIANPGLAPSLPPSSGGTYVLRGDAQWFPIAQLQFQYSQILGAPTSLPPNPHQLTHVTVGSDLILPPTTSRPGLVPILLTSAQQVNFLRGDSTWAVIPPVSATSSGLIAAFPNTTNVFYRGDGNYTAVDWNTGVSNRPATFAAIPHALTHINIAQDQIPLFSKAGVLPGLTPASQGDTVNYLRADGTWNTPPGGGGLATPTGAGLLNQLPPAPGTTFYLGGDNLFHPINTLQINYGQVIGTPIFTGGQPGLVPLSTGVITLFLRADGTFNVPQGNPVSTTSSGTVSPLPSTSGASFFLNGLNAWANLSTITVDYTNQVTGKPPGFNPIAHASTHFTAGQDLIVAATTTHPGLVPSLPSTTPQLQFLRGDSNFAPIPPVSSSASGLVPAYPNSQFQWFRGDGLFATILNTSPTNAGLAPILPNNSTTFFRADGNYTGVDYNTAVINKPPDFIPRAHNTSHVTGGNDQILPFTATATGLVPFSGGGTSNFLRADGSWITPTGAGDVSHTLTITGVPNQSVVGGGDLSANRTFSLSGDVNTPAANSVYSYVGGSRGWNTFASFPVVSTGAAGLVPPANFTTAQFLNGTGSFSTPLRFSQTLDGYAPATGAVLTNFLKSDGTWSPLPVINTANTTTAGTVPSLQAVGVNTTYYLQGDNSWQLKSSLFIAFDHVTGVPIFSGGFPGLVPTSDGSASKFLGGDGQFKVPLLAASALPGYIAGLQSANATAYWARGDNSWNLLPNSILVASPWPMPPVGLSVSGVQVNDTSILEPGLSLMNLGPSATNCLMEISSINTINSTITLINRGYVINPAPSTSIPGGLMFITGPGSMTNVAPGFVPPPPSPPDGTKFLSGLGTWLIPAGVGGGLSTVSVQGSIQGDGNTAPLHLANDNVSPGPYRFYSTDSIGTKGWLPLTYSWETSATFTMPGVGAIQTITLISNTGMLPGMTLIIEDSSFPIANQAFLEVVTVNGDGIHIVVKNQGYAINSTPLVTTFANNAAVTLAGPGIAGPNIPGFVPPPPNNTVQFLRADGQFQTPSRFSGTQDGYVPQVSPNNTQFLRADLAWAVPNITQQAIIGTAGSVPALLSSGQATSFLRGDNAWRPMTDIVMPYSQLSSVPSTFSPSIHGSHHSSGDVSINADAIPVFSTSTTASGLVPGSNGSANTFLKSDGSWSSTPSGPSLAVAGTDGLLKGLIASPTLQYLRGDNDWFPISGIQIPYGNLLGPPPFAAVSHGSTHLDPAGGGTDPIPVVAGARTGLVPVLPASTPGTRFLSGLATWIPIPGVVNGTAGLIPGTGFDGTPTKFFSADGTYKVIPVATSAGPTSGLVPTPTNLTYQYLRGDAQFASIPFTWNITTGFTQPAASANTSPAVVFTSTTGLVANMVIATIDSSNQTNYYSVFSISDLTHAVLTNINCAGNTAAAATVNPGSAKLVSAPVVSPNGAGIVPKPPNDPAQFLNGQGTFTVPPATGISTSQTLVTQYSITGGGLIAAGLTLNLVNDTLNPGLSMLYGTNPSGARGWQSFTGLPLATTSNPGLLLTLNNNSGQFLNGQGAWSAPSNLPPASSGQPGTLVGLPAVPPAFPTQVQWLRADNQWAFPNNCNATTSSWVMPAIGSTVPSVTFPSPNGTANFDAGMTLLFATGNGTTVCFMEVVSIDTGTTMTLRNQGYNANASNPGNTVAAGPVYIAGPGVAVAGTGGFPGGAGLVPSPPASGPTVKFLRGDATWTQVDYSMLTGSPAGLPQIQLSWALTGSTFSQPVVGGTVNLLVTSSAGAVTNRGVIIPGAGYYFIQNVPDLTHITVQNNGHAYNQLPGTPGLGGVGVYIIGASNANLFTLGWSGDVPKSTGTNTDFLRADGAWGSATGASFIQHASALTAASTTTPACQFPGNTTTGNCIIAMVSPGAASNTISSVTDSNSNTYIHGVGLLTNANPVDLWYALNITGGTTPTITAHFGSANTNSFVCIAEFSGILTSSAADGAGAAAFQTAATNLSSGSVTTANANDLLIGFSNWSTVFVSGEAAWNSFSDGFQYRVVNSTGSYASTFTINGAGNASSLIFALKGVSLLSSSRQILTTNSLGGGGPLTSDLTLTLSGDTLSPGNWFLYSTNGLGTKGWNLSTNFPQATSTTAGLVPTPSATATDLWLRGDASWVQAPPLAKTITSAFNWPAYGGTSASIAVDSIANMRAGMALYLPGLGVAELMTASAGAITIRNNGNSGNAGSTAGVAIGTAIYVGGGGAICTTTTTGDVPIPGGVANTFFSGASATFVQPPNCTASTPGYANPPNNTTTWLRGDAQWTAVPYASLTGTPVSDPFATVSAFTILAAGTPITLTISSSTWPIVGQVVQINDGTTFGFFEITTVTSSTSIQVTNRGYLGTPVSGPMGAATMTLSGPGQATSTKAGLMRLPSGTATDFYGGDAAFHAHSTVPLDTLGATTDITTLNSSTTAHGLLPKLDNVVTHFLNGQGGWTAPAAGTSSLTTFSAFTVPAINVTVPVTVASASDMVVGETHVLTDGTLFMVGRITVIASLVITYSNQGGGGSVSGAMGAGRVYFGSGIAAINNTATTFLSGANTFVTPPTATASTPGYVNPPNNTFTFLRGDATFAKPDGTMTTTTATFTVPAAHALTAGSIVINSVTWPIVGQKVYITDGTLVMYGNITTVTDATHITVRNTGDTGNSVAGTMAIGATVVLVGFQIPIFRQWQAALEYSPPATLYGVFGTQNARPHLAFNDSATWTANFFGVVPSGTYLGAGLIIRLKWKSITTNAGNAIWNVAIERLNTAESADSFDTGVLSSAAACSGTQSALVETAITITTIDGLVAGDGFGLQVQRVGGNGSDTLVGDACLRLVTVESVI